MVPSSRWAVSVSTKASSSSVREADATEVVCEDDPEVVKPPGVMPMIGMADGVCVVLMLICCSGSSRLLPADEPIRKAGTSNTSCSSGSLLVLLCCCCWYDSSKSFVGGSCRCSSGEWNRDLYIFDWLIDVDWILIEFWLAVLALLACCDYCSAAGDRLVHSSSQSSHNSLSIDSKCLLVSVSVVHVMHALTWLTCSLDRPERRQNPHPTKRAISLDSQNSWSVNIPFYNVQSCSPMTQPLHSSEKRGIKYMNYQ